MAKRRSTNGKQAKKGTSKGSKASASSKTPAKKSAVKKKTSRRGKSDTAMLFDIDVDSDDLQRIPLREAAQTRYLNYSLSVITSRALPDVRDGLKPVQRRILYTMHQERITHTS